MANNDVDEGAAPDLPAGGDGYPSDLRDVEWARLAPLIPPAPPGGRPRKTDIRAAMNAILYLLRTGCPWRYLPRDSFPLRSTVYNIFRKFQRDGTWEAIWAELHMASRERMGREASPSAAVLDSQSVKSVEKGRQRQPRAIMDLTAHGDSPILYLGEISDAASDRTFPSLLPQ